MGRNLRLFRRWQRNGTWKRILEQLQVQADAQGLITWELDRLPCPPARRWCA
ncbi:hypothetical protein SBADM41S_05924 [Streptomyces badius]|nr:hypothetical protein [Streptomyces sp. S063]